MSIIEITIGQLVDYVAASHRDLSINLKINRRECTMWVYDFTTTTGTYVSDFSTLEEDLVARQQSDLANTIRKLRDNGYQISSPS